MTFILVELTLKTTLLAENQIRNGLTEREAANEQSDKDEGGIRIKSNGVLATHNVS